MTGISIPVHGAASLREGACATIAEAGVNHNNSVERALEMVRQAAKAGAWGIKFQLYKAARIASRYSPKYWTDSIGTTTQYEAFTRSDRIAYEDYAPVAELCRELGIVFFATPFDLEAVDALENLSAPMYKVASGDITYKQLLERIAQTGKPVLLSTGASTVDEIEQALEWLGGDPTRIVPLVCTLTYPTPDHDGNFARIETFKERFAPHLVGMSDHTLGSAGGWMTAALGGVCIEKHYTLDKSLGEVPDHAISVDPIELAELVQACNRGAVLRGGADVGVRTSEIPARDNARRSLVATRDLLAGSTLAEGDLAAKRPGTGIPPARLSEFVGRALARDLDPDQLLAEGDVVKRGD